MARNSELGRQYDALEQAEAANRRQIASLSEDEFDDEVRSFVPKYII